ncbi:MAG: hypothetical protein WCZ86_08720 [Desulfurivibrionaceae bacterium]|jgi:hypothetical protein
MCIILDTCAFSSVFDPTSSEHAEFKPLLTWLTQGKGKLVYGGTKYKSELANAIKFLKIFGHFNRAGKLVEVDDETVDLFEKEISSVINEKACNDPHLIAIVIVSKCRLICSSDKRSYKYLKQSRLYPKGVRAPKLYTKSKNSGLLSDKNFAKICLPSSSGSKDLSQLFNP